jgi:type II secretory pathway pseudopilin PulG
VEWHKARRGFSIIEAVMVIVIVATILGALSPSVARQLSHARINRGAAVVAADFYMAQALAGRMRTPVRIDFNTSDKQLVIVNPATSTTLFTRRLGSDSEFRLTGMSVTVANVLVLPNGTSNSTVSVTLGDASFSKRITMSRAGQIRVYP